MRKLSILLALVAGLFISEAKADFTGKDAAAATITFKNPGNCTAVVCVPVFQLYDGTNVVTLTTAGADAASNTLTGLPTYSRMLFYNGTTWDRWQGAVTATLAAETTKVIGTVRIASGGVASGSFASGSIASGALASGSIASGAMVDLGSQADAACGTATGTCSLIALQKYNNTATGSAVPAGTNIIGKVGIDQTTPGTTNAVSATNLPTTVSTGTGAQGASSPRVTVATDQATNAGAALVNGGVGVVSGGSAYETVAASQTAQALGATGGTGDYLSHCVIYPTTTTPGVVTVFDNTNAAGTNVIAFPGGASSVSNLAPISIPVGAVSTAGAWKVTTGANLVVTCYGKFT